MIEHPVIYADFNNCDVQGRVRLNIAGSQRDLGSTGVRLDDGVVLHLTDNELEVIGTAEFSEEENIWTARFSWDELREIPGTQDDGNDRS
jgi:hypothetical protein